MSKVYKVEIFSSEFDFRSVSITSDIDLSFDYLTLDTLTVSVYGIEAFKGDYVHITDLYGVRYYQGIVTDLSWDKKVATLSLKPLLSLLDVQCYCPASKLSEGTLEQFLAYMIESTYVTNEDELQRLPNCTVIQRTATNDAKLDLEDNIQELWNVCLSALSLYDVVVSAEFNPQTKAITFIIGKEQSTFIEADIANCLNKEFTFTNDYGSLNKVIYINADDPEDTATYYLHPNGEVDTSDENRISPVFFKIEEISAEDFDESAENKAYEALAKQTYDNLIELTYLLEDPLVKPTSIPIGSVAEISHDGLVYTSILTGYEYSNGIIKLSFGFIRNELTKKLLMERRS